MKMQRWGVCTSLLLIVTCVSCASESPSPSSTSNKPSSTDTATDPPASSDTTSDAPGSSSTDETTEVKEGWGSFKGRFVYDGEAPEPTPLTITKDQQFCGKHNLVDESLMVDKDSGGLANVCVYLTVSRRADPPEIHESYAASADAKVVLDNNQCRFEPRVCLLQTSQTLVIKNSDEVGHNTNISLNSNPSFNQTIPTGEELEHKLSASERLPAQVACNIHPWMQGWVLPQETPYFAVTAKDGSFEIKNLPAGKWTFQVWHEKAKSVAEVSIGGETVTWSKGRVEVTISGDQTTDLGEIKLAPALFNG